MELQIGSKVVNVRQMTDEEMTAEYWEGNAPPMVIELEGNVKLFPSVDPEGNYPGYFTGDIDKIKGETFTGIVPATDREIRKRSWQVDHLHGWPNVLTFGKLKVFVSGDRGYGTLFVESPEGTFTIISSKECHA